MSHSPEDLEALHTEANLLNEAIPKTAPIKGDYWHASTQDYATGLLRHDFFGEGGQFAIEDLRDEWDAQMEEDRETEGPLAGDVDPTGGYDDETEYVDLRELEVNETIDGEIVDGYGNLIEF